MELTLFLWEGVKGTILLRRAMRGAVKIYVRWSKKRNQLVYFLVGKSYVFITAFYEVRINIDLPFVFMLRSFL